MWAMVAKEFRQLRRDRRTLVMMLVLPVLLLVVFGYAANFEVHDISTVVVGPDAGTMASSLHAPLHVVSVDPSRSESFATSELRHGTAVVGVVTGPGGALVLMDGSQLFSVQTAEAALAKLAPSAGAGGHAMQVRILFNPSLKTSWVMVPGLAGLILVFIGTMITSLGVVRERQAGTLEQLAVMPLRAFQVIAGKIALYLAVAACDLTLVVLVGMGLFGVPFVGNVGTFLLGAALFLLVTSTPAPRSASARICSHRRALASGPTPDVGSSSTNSSGWCARATAKATCRWTPSGSVPTNVSCHDETWSGSARSAWWNAAAAKRQFSSTVRSS